MIRVLTKLEMVQPAVGAAVSSFSNGSLAATEKNFISEFVTRLPRAVLFDFTASFVFTAVGGENSPVGHVEGLGRTCY